jgi:hypothetical protein
MAFAMIFESFHYLDLSQSQVDLLDFIESFNYFHLIYSGVF